MAANGQPTAAEVEAWVQATLHNSTHHNGVIRRRGKWEVRVNLGLGISMIDSDHPQYGRTHYVGRYSAQDEAVDAYRRTVFKTVWPDSDGNGEPGKVVNPAALHPALRPTNQVSVSRRLSARSSKYRSATGAAGKSNPVSRAQSHLTLTLPPRMYLQLGGTQSLANHPAVPACLVAPRAVRPGSSAPETSDGFQYCVVSRERPPVSLTQRAAPLLHRIGRNSRRRLAQYGATGSGSNANQGDTISDNDSDNSSSDDEDWNSAASDSWPPLADEESYILRDAVTGKALMAALPLKRVNIAVSRPPNCHDRGYAFFDLAWDHEHMQEYCGFTGAASGALGSPASGHGAGPGFNGSSASYDRGMWGTRGSMRTPSMSTISTAASEGGRDGCSKVVQAMPTLSPSQQSWTGSGHPPTAPVTAGKGLPTHLRKNQPAVALLAPIQGLHLQRHLHGPAFQALLLDPLILPSHNTNAAAVSALHTSRSVDSTPSTPRPIPRSPQAHEEADTVAILMEDLDEAEEGAGGGTEEEAGGSRRRLLLHEGQNGTMKSKANTPSTGARGIIDCSDQFRVGDSPQGKAAAQHTVARLSDGKAWEPTTGSSLLSSASGLGAARNRFRAPLSDQDISAIVLSLWRPAPQSAAVATAGAVKSDTLRDNGVHSEPRSPEDINPLSPDDMLIDTDIAARTDHSSLPYTRSARRLGWVEQSNESIGDNTSSNQDRVADGAWKHGALRSPRSVDMASEGGELRKPMIAAAHTMNDDRHNDIDDVVVTLPPTSPLAGPAGEMPASPAAEHRRAAHWTSRSSQLLHRAQPLVCAVLPSISPSQLPWMCPWLHAALESGALPLTRRSCRVTDPATPNPTIGKTGSNKRPWRHGVQDVIPSAICTVQTHNCPQYTTSHHVLPPTLCVTASAQPIHLPCSPGGGAFQGVQATAVVSSVAPSSRETPAASSPRTDTHEYTPLHLLGPSSAQCDVPLVGGRAATAAPSVKSLQLAVSPLEVRTILLPGDKQQQLRNQAPTNDSVRSDISHRVDKPKSHERLKRTASLAPPVGANGPDGVDITSAQNPSETSSKVDVFSMEPTPIGMDSQLSSTPHAPQLALHNTTTRTSSAPAAMSRAARDQMSRPPRRMRHSTMGGAHEDAIVGTGAASDTAMEVSLPGAAQSIGPSRPSPASRPSARPPRPLSGKGSSARALLQRLGSERAVDSRLMLTSPPTPAGSAPGCTHSGVRAEVSQSEAVAVHVAASDSVPKDDKTAQVKHSKRSHRRRRRKDPLRYRKLAANRNTELKSQDGGGDNGSSRQTASLSTAKSRSSQRSQAVAATTAQASLDRRRTALDPAPAAADIQAKRRRESNRRSNASAAAPSRATAPSTSEMAPAVIQFGRLKGGDRHQFFLDFQAPWTPLQAFAVAVFQLSPANTPTL